MNACLVVLGLLARGGCPAPGPQPDVPAIAADRWVGEDKLRHLTLSFGATVMAAGTARFALDPGPSRAAAAGLALVLGIGKEIDDARSGRRFSLEDLAWDAAGVALGFALADRSR